MASAGVKVVVVGSVNMDLVCFVPKALPVPVGATVTGTGFLQTCGGKGANQAVAAGRLAPGTVAMIAKVGDDAFGKDMCDNLASAGVAVAGSVTPVADTPSGVALITVDNAGDNSIVVVPGANGVLSPADVAPHADMLAAARVVVAQCETPFDATTAAFTAAKRGGAAITVFNPAPAGDPLPADLLAACDILVPNETEAELITGVKVHDDASAAEACQKLLNMGCKAAIVTLGARGCAVQVAGGMFSVVKASAVPPESVVDTTGAGDAFVGSLAYFLGESASLASSGAADSTTLQRVLLEAIGRAQHVAGVSIQRKGAQNTPGRDDSELPAHLLDPMP